MINAKYKTFSEQLAEYKRSKIDARAGERLPETKQANQEKVLMEIAAIAGGNQMKFQSNKTPRSPNGTRRDYENKEVHGEDHFGMGQQKHPRQREQWYVMAEETYNDSHSYAVKSHDYTAAYLCGLNETQQKFVEVVYMATGDKLGLAKMLLADYNSNPSDVMVDAYAIGAALTAFLAGKDYVSKACVGCDTWRATRALRWIQSLDRQCKAKMVSNAGCGEINSKAAKVKPVFRISYNWSAISATQITKTVEN